MWWKLPAELIEQILAHVSFPEYVALTQVSSEFRAVLDNERLLSTVLKGNYRSFVESYIWPIDPKVSKTQLWTAFGHSRVFFDSVDVVFRTRDASATSITNSHPPEFTSTVEALSQVELLEEFYRLSREGNGESNGDYRRKIWMDVGLNVLATQDIYAFPLMTEFHDSQRSFEEVCSGASLPKYVSLSRLSWSRRLLQLQNFGQTVKFFRETRYTDTTDIERCYFELSRCYNDFDRLADHRTSKLKQMKNSLREKLPLSKGELMFPSQNAYKLFLEGIIKTLLPHLRSREAHFGQGGNILRIYEGSGRESQSLYLSILAKLLKEVIFDRISIKFPGTKGEKKKVYISFFFLIIGSIYISVDFDQGSVSIYSESDLQRLPLASTTQVKSPIVCSDVIQRAFEMNESGADIVSNFETINWKHSHISTCQEKLRFIRTILIPISENQELDYSQYSPLVHENDFFQYFFCAQAQVRPAGPEKHRFLEHIIQKRKEIEVNERFCTGDLVVNSASNYFGIVLGVNDVVSEHGAFFETLPFDRVERSIAQETSLKLLNTRRLGDQLAPFLDWIVSTEGFNYAAMFLYPNLYIDCSKLQLTADTNHTCIQ